LIYRSKQTAILTIGILFSLIAPLNAQTQSVRAQEAGKVAASESAAANREATDSKATLYIYRYKQMLGSGLEPSVYCNETQLARMDNGRYFKVMLDPGKYELRSNDKQSGIEMELKGGEQYYVRVDIAPGFWKAHGRLVLMQKEQGAYEIKKLKPLGADKIKDHQLVVAEETSDK
jgi:hypothetical protein